MYEWALNSMARRKSCGAPREFERATRWLERNKLPLAAVENPRVIRRALDELARKRDGTPAAAKSFMRKRAVFFNTLEYAVELGHLVSNPFAAQIAGWAGHSVAVLLQVYVRCIADRDEIAKQRIEQAQVQESRGRSQRRN